MKELLINNRRGERIVTFVDDDMYDTLSKMKWSLSGGVYARFSSKPTGSILLHRLIVNAKKGEIVDHIDHNTLNNQRSNLRIVTSQQNAVNRQCVAKSGFKGVYQNYREPGKWIAAIVINKKYTRIGAYDTAQEAARAFNTKALELHGEFACLNDV